MNNLPAILHDHEIEQLRQFKNISGVRFVDFQQTEDGLYIQSDFGAPFVTPATEQETIIGEKPQTHYSARIKKNPSGHVLRIPTLGIVGKNIDSYVIDANAFIANNVRQLFTGYCAIESEPVNDKRRVLISRYLQNEDMEETNILAEKVIDAIKLTARFENTYVNKFK